MRLFKLLLRRNHEGMFIKAEQSGRPPSTILIRRDTTDRWEEINPILECGELGLDTRRGTLRCGDGIRKWNALAEFYPRFNGSVCIGLAHSRQELEIAELKQRIDDLEEQIRNEEEMRGL